MIKGVFFDLYGTLIVTGETTFSGWLDDFHNCLQVYGLAMSKADFTGKCHDFFNKDEPQKQDDGLTIYERRIKTFCTELGLEIDTEGIKYTANHTIEIANKNCYLDPDCHTVLKTLQKRKTLALITNFDHSPHIKAMLRKMELEQYFTTIIVSEEVGVKKPDPGIFHLALRNTGLKPEEVVHVGDSITDDISGAISAGLAPIFIQRNRSDQENLSSIINDDFMAVGSSTNASIPKVIKTIQRLSELVDIVE